MLKKIKKIGLLSLILLPLIGFGESNITESPIVVTESAFTSSLMHIINWFFYLLVFAAVVLIIFGAWRYISAKGEESDIKAAHQYIVWAVIAVIVALLARSIVAFVLNISQQGSKMM